MSQLRMNKFRLLLGREFVALLLFALVLVPVFQATHALTHIESPGTVPDVALIAQVGDVAPGENGADADSDFDKICLDCLALAGFSILFPALAIHFFSPATRLLNSRLNSRRRFLNFSPLYLSRAPPQA